MAVEVTSEKKECVIGVLGYMQYGFSSIYLFIFIHEVDLLLS